MSSLLTFALEMKRCEEVSGKPKNIDMKLPELCFVFDVESVGLHGEGFAVGYVVLQDGKIIKEDLYACPIIEGLGFESDVAWCHANIPELAYTHSDACGVRESFWLVWSHWKDEGALMFAECAWPVEARFLEDCVGDDSAYLTNAPYPLHDIASIMLARGMDPMAKYDRLPDELPKHNPLCDARQSARLLIEAFNR